MDHVRLPKKKRSKLSAEQKAAFVLIMFLGFGGIIMGFKSFGANLSRPFEIQLAEAVANANGEFMLSSEREARELEAQKTRDTDGDGLNDYDELFVFKTSPYLEDSDSDGFSDKEEVFSGNDPNCPKGKVCRGIVAGSENSGTIGADPDKLIDGVPKSEATLEGALNQFNAQQFSSDQEVIDFFSKMSSEDIREALVLSGVPVETLDLIDDETLKETFDKAMQDAVESGDFQDEINAAMEVTDQTQIDQ